jgi:hypothetical protein
MNERMDEYVRLFPVHPDYIGTFEQLIFTEKRGALVTLRDQIQAVLNDEVPADRPGLIGYDKFWDTMTSNSVLRSDPNIGSPEGLRGAWPSACRRLHAPGLQADGAARHRRPGRASPDHGRRHPRAIGPTAAELRDACVCSSRAWRTCRAIRPRTCCRWCRP